MVIGSCNCHIRCACRTRHSSRVPIIALSESRIQHSFRGFLYRTVRCTCRIRYLSRVCCIALSDADVVRHCAFRIGKAIHGLHFDVVVHGDVKPRNIVREGGSDFKMIDLDMAFSVRMQFPTPSWYFPMGAIYTLDDCRGV